MRPTFNATNCRLCGEFSIFTAALGGHMREPDYNAVWREFCALEQTSNIFLPETRLAEIMLGGNLLRRGVVVDSPPLRGVY
jgi:hypothetical protein